MSTTDKPDPARGARFLAKLVAEDEAERIASLSDEAFLAEQRQQGRDLEPTPSTAELLERVKARATREATAPAPVAQATEAVAHVLAMPRPRPRSQLFLGLLAAAFGVGLVVFVATRPDNVAQFHPDPTAREQAEALRDDAIGSCAQGVWNVCKHRLDDAAKLDPAGESEPRVQKARADIANADPGSKGTWNPGK